MKKGNHRKILKEKLIETLKSEPSETIEQDASVAYDGKHFLVRFPKKISDSLEIQKGETVKFRLVLPKGESAKNAKLEMLFR